MPSFDARYNKLKSNLPLNWFNIELISASVNITESAMVDVFLTLLSFSFSNEDNLSFNSFNLSSDDLFSFSESSICVFNFFSCSSNSLYSFSREEYLLFNSVNSLFSGISLSCFFNFSNFSFNSVCLFVNKDICEFKEFISIWSLLLLSFISFILSFSLLLFFDFFAFTIIIIITIKDINATPKITIFFNAGKSLFELGWNTLYNN